MVSKAFSLTRRSKDIQKNKKKKRDDYNNDKEDSDSDNSMRGANDESDRDDDGDQEISVNKDQQQGNTQKRVMQRKKLDPRVPAQIQNGVQTNHRSFFVMVGDRGKDQVVTLHYLLSKARVSARPSVLWCYKKDLGFSSHRKKRMKIIQAQIARGQREADQDDPFELFVSSTSIRYTYYKETDRILGTTFGMCVLQDFEALTPNLLARTIETVEGGGIVVILLKTMNSLKQLYTMTMDIHARYRTEAHQDTVARFNERFLLSLGSCDSCLVVDDELNVLPLSGGRFVKALPRQEDTPLTPSQEELADVKKSVQDTKPLGPLVSLAKTLDQAQAILTFIEAIADKTLRSTISLTASRGRGKSAALGVAVAGAVAYGYSNIFITSPSPENLKTLFEFVFKAFDALGYEEHVDYDIVQSTNPAFQKAVVRVNIFKEHRQTIQYIQPTDAAVLAQAELVVIDEAAAIPLTIVKSLLGPYLVFMASTINGYEGTGRSLSLKLLAQLREQSRSTTTVADAVGGVVVSRDGKKSGTTGSGTGGSGLAAPTAGLTTATARVLKEVKLEEPIRYNAGDAVETWLTKLLCLDACEPTASSVPRSFSNASGCPHPSECELFYVNRDTLFSFHPVSEAFLQKMMSLYVASHYKNTPNDLQLLSDAPAHHLFVLLPPISKNTPGKPATLPEPLVVLQVCMEGRIARNTVLSSLSRGVRTSGDLIPWVVSQQFQDDGFASLSGARVVRVATHPDFMGMGYGSQAMKRLEEYYRGAFDKVDLREEEEEGLTSVRRVTDEDIANASLSTDTIKVREAASMPPLLLRLTERPAKEKLDWLGVSFGFTQPLFKFWRRAGFAPVYLRQTTNELTGEHSCVVLRPLMRPNSGDDDIVVGNPEWVDAFSWDFRRRFIELCGYQFRRFAPLAVLSVLDACSNGRPKSLGYIETRAQVHAHFTPYDLKRLDAYTQNLLDYHVIIDLVPTLARLYFLMHFTPPTTSSASSTTDETKERVPVQLSPVQSGILAGVGLQFKSLEEVSGEVGLSVSQVMALFGKVVRKLSLYMVNVEETELAMEEESKRKSVSKLLGGGETKRKRGGADAEESDDEDDVEANGKANGRKDIDDEAAWDPLQIGLDEDLEEEGGAVAEALRQRQREMINSLDLKQYEIEVDEKEFASATRGKGKGVGPNIVQIRNKNSTKKRKHEQATGTAAKLAEEIHGEKTGVYNPQAAAGKSIKGKKGSKR